MNIQAFMEQMQAMQAAIAEMQQNHKVLADTLAAQKSITADDVAGIVTGKLDEYRQQQAKTARRQSVIDQLKAKGVPEEIITAHVPDTDDLEQLRAGGQKVIDRWNEMQPRPKNQGGANRDGGYAPGTLSLQEQRNPNPAELVAAGLARPRPSAVTE